MWVYGNVTNRYTFTAKRIAQKMSVLKRAHFIELIWNHMKHFKENLNFREAPTRSST